MKKQTYNFALSPDIKEALEVAAQKDRRSMSSLLEKIIVDHLEKEGIPWEDKEPASTVFKDSRTKKTNSKKRVPGEA